MDDVIDLTVDDVIDLTIDDVTPREERSQRRADEALERDNRKVARTGTVTRSARLRENVSDDLFLDIIQSLSVSRFPMFQCIQCSGTTLS